MFVECATRQRVYPTPDQKQAMARVFGCVRFVRNYAKDMKDTTYREKGEVLFYKDLSKELTQLKKTYPWLKEVSSVPLQQTLRHLDTAYKNFFKGNARFPKFKARKNKQSVTFMRNAFDWDGDELRLAKVDGPLDIRWSLTLPKGADITSVTLTKDEANRYFVTFHFKKRVRPKKRVGKETGLDLGLKDYITSDKGESVVHHKSLWEKDEERLKTLQKRLSRKQKGSKNREKARLKVAKCHKRISDIRNDFLHKLSSALVDENQAIHVETLLVRNMVRNPHLSKAIAQSGWGEFVRQLEYKCHWYGRRFTRISQWHPSSQLCSTPGCDYRNTGLKLSDRSWKCPQCHVTHHRDVNAARNILAEGRSVMACGGDVSPAGIAAVAGEAGKVVS